MPHRIHFALCLHNHQPIGNFDGVIEQALADSYRPFLDVFKEYPSLRMSLHTSGVLAEWLDERHPEYLDELAELAADGRIEIMGGGFYEPIFSMVPRRDRLGQIRTYTRWLQRRLGAEVRGAWIPERVWEPSMVSDLAEAGIQFTVLDDYHFKNAGLAPEELHGYYVCEDDGRLLAVFPGSEPLRYLIPFQAPERTIDHLREIAQSHPESVAVFADDGEKFGTWPGTKHYVYDERWLRRFFDLLVANQSWIVPTTLGDALTGLPPTGKIYLPNCSYREMTEWALPVERLLEYERLQHDLAEHPDLAGLSQFMRGGIWRNFRIKYPEADEMYTRMLMVSERLAAAEEAGQSPKLVDAARAELYRGQCNCAYWHGVFGGIYLPHLRNAVYSRLISADNLLDRAARREAPWVEGVAADFNLDARQEVYLTNDRLACLIGPLAGGRLYELDVRSICHNLLATLARRPEAYHRKVLAGPASDNGQVSSIHDRVVFKQPGLDERLHYDDRLRKSLIDHFYDNDVSLAAVAASEAAERGDFADGKYEARLRRKQGRVQAQLARTGNAWGHPLTISKAITLEAGASKLEIGYLLEDLPPHVPLHFAVEFNFAGLPGGLSDRYFHGDSAGRLGHLGESLDLAGAHSLSLADEWLGIDVALRLSRPGGIWAFPIETVSQSEGGFELVHQSVAVIPHWIIEADAKGQWSVTIELAIDTSAAEGRHHDSVTAAAVV